MRARMTKLFAGVAAIAALAVGGSALAGAAGNQAAPTKAPAVAAKTLKAVGPTGVNQAPGDPSQESATETAEGAPESASEAASETASEPAESASEVPGSDRPGGHADEPGNPTADHQFEGQE
jgi:hypothetical protein